MTQKQDLTAIDWTKLDLPKWKGIPAKIQAHDGALDVTYLGVTYTDGAYLLRSTEGVWTLAFYAVTSQAGFQEFGSIPYKVDQFIETELARLNAPEWVEVKWTEVERLQKAGARIQLKKRGSSDENFVDREPCGYEWICRGDVVEYQVDLKTVPVGVALYEPDWVDVFPGEVRRVQGLGIRVQCKNPNKDGDDFEYHPVDEWIGCPDWRFRADRKTFPAGFELSPKVKSEPNWLPCTREEAEANPGDSECWSINEYRTRAKLDRWVRVPHYEANRLRREGAKLETDVFSYKVDRSTLPAGYVLGVGFVEEAKSEEAKTKTIRNRVYERMAELMLCKPDMVRVTTAVDALLDVLDAERTGK
jgi:hypothetical protein